MRYRDLAALLPLVACLALPAAGEFMMTESAPVDRIIQNATAYTEEHPEEAHGYYTLARAHYLAWSEKSGTIPVHGWPGQQDKDDGLANLPDVTNPAVGGRPWRLLYAEARRRTVAKLGYDFDAQTPDKQREQFWAEFAKQQEALEKENWQPEELDEEELDEHAKQAIAHYRKAIELESGNALFHIGLASLREQYAERASHTGLGPSGDAMLDLGGPKLENLWLREAMNGYAAAYQLAIKRDRKTEHTPLQGLGSLISYNAIEGYIRTGKALGGEGMDGKLARAMQKDKADFDNLPPGLITPIIFTLNPHAQHAADLLDPDTIVRFDLDGDGVAERRPWVKPDTAILVWDPHNTGRIASGRQLFGSVTWWLMPGDGYRAMDLLDDNRDGELAGDELPGLALWLDTNQNAISDPGEVTPIADTPVAGLRVEALSQDGEHPTHRHGLRLRDDTHRPTWDWIAPAVDE